MIFEQRPERDEDFSYAVIWQNSILDRGTVSAKVSRWKQLSMVECAMGKREEETKKVTAS